MLLFNDASGSLLFLIVSHFTLSSRHGKTALPIGLRHYASGKKVPVNQYSANITQPKSQGASQAMCKYFI